MCQAYKGNIRAYIAGFDTSTGKHRIMCGCTKLQSKHYLTIVTKVLDQARQLVSMGDTSLTKTILHRMLQDAVVEFEPSSDFAKSMCLV